MSWNFQVRKGVRVRCDYPHELFPLALFLCAIFPVSDFLFSRSGRCSPRLPLQAALPPPRPQPLQQTTATATILIPTTKAAFSGRQLLLNQCSPRRSFNVPHLLLLLPQGLPRAVVLPPHICLNSLLFRRVLVQWRSLRRGIILRFLSG